MKNLEFSIGVVFKSEKDIDPDLAWVIVNQAAQSLNIDYHGGDSIEMIEVSEPFADPLESSEKGEVYGD